MPLTLDDGTTTLFLPEDLEWVDEFEWNPVGQDIQYGIGVMVVSENVFAAGRPITLVGGDNVWALKQDIDALYLMLNNANKQMTLTLPDLRSFTVMFNRSETALDAKPVWRKRVQENNDYYTLTIRLMEV